MLLALGLGLAVMPALAAEGKNDARGAVLREEPAAQAAAPSPDDTYKDRGTNVASSAAQYDGPADGRSGAGMATGFVAGGLGLALIGLFVKRNGRHPDDHFDEEELRPARRL